MIGIYKVKILTGLLKDMAKDEGLDDNDIVLITMEKIEGSPTQWLQDKCVDNKSGDIRIHKNCNLCDNLIISTYEMTEKSESGYIIDCLKKPMRNCLDFKPKTDGG